MIIETFPTRQQFATSYLQSLQGLASEIAGAMQAISSNSMTTLHMSIARQQILCAELAAMEHALAQGDRSNEHSGIPMDARVEIEIGIARRAIVELNLQYSYLLKHSGRTIALLLSLCRSRTGQSQEARGSRLKQKTWSCEM